MVPLIINNAIVQSSYAKINICCKTFEVATPEDHESLALRIFPLYGI